MLVRRYEPFKSGLCKRISAISTRDESLVHQVVDERLFIHLGEVISIRMNGYFVSLLDFDSKEILGSRVKEVEVA